MNTAWIYPSQVGGNVPRGHPPTYNSIMHRGNPLFQIDTMPGGNNPRINPFLQWSGQFIGSTQSSWVPPPKWENMPWNTKQSQGKQSYSTTPIRSPFLSTLNQLDLSWFSNDLVLHLNGWPVIPTKPPSDIPKFDGNPLNDPSTHVMTFHLW